MDALTDRGITCTHGIKHDIHGYYLSLCDVSIFVNMSLMFSNGIIALETNVDEIEWILRFYMYLSNVVIDNTLLHTKDYLPQFNDLCIRLVRDTILAYHNNDFAVHVKIGDSDYTNNLKIHKRKPELFKEYIPYINKAAKK